MCELATIARPYAKAAFDFAVEYQAVAQWQNMLAFASKVSCSRHMKKLFSCIMAPEKLANLFITICGDRLNSFGRNLIQVMAENKRLVLLPYVLEQFNRLRTVHESIVEVEIISASSLSKEQLEKITAIMTQRLAYNIKLNCKIDQSVLAGIIIRIGDMVLDGSVRGRLDRLVNILQS